VHSSAVKRALAGLALIAISHAAPAQEAAAPRGFVIERSHVDLAPPLDAVDMQRFAQGIPPRVWCFPLIAYDAWPGFFAFRCGECGGRCYHNSNTFLEIGLGQHVRFSVADLIGLSEAQGMRVLRGPDGGIQQAESAKNVYFIRQEKDVIVTEKYMAFDCEATADGSMKPLPGAECRSGLELRELAPDPAKGIRRFQILVLHEASGTVTLIFEFQETKGRAQFVKYNYKGDKISPENLRAQTSFQRVFWKEGPGYRQILKHEVRQPDGSLQLTEHTIASWHVAKDGSRKLVETQKLVDPPERAQAEPVH